jgi:hypothetical protein
VSDLWARLRRPLADGSGGLWPGVGFGKDELDDMSGLVVNLQDRLYVRFMTWLGPGNDQGSIITAWKRAHKLSGSPRVGASR